MICRIFLSQLRYFRLDTLKFNLKAFSELLALLLEISPDLCLVLEIGLELIGRGVVDGAMDEIDFLDKA